MGDFVVVEYIIVGVGVLVTVGLLVHEKLTDRPAETTLSEREAAEIEAEWSNAIK